MANAHSNCSSHPDLGQVAGSPKSIRGEGYLQFVFTSNSYVIILNTSTFHGGRSNRLINIVPRVSLLSYPGEKRLLERVCRLHNQPELSHLFAHGTDQSKGDEAITISPTVVDFFLSFFFIFSTYSIKTYSIKHTNYQDTKEIIIGC